jgi:amidase
LSDPGRGRLNPARLIGDLNSPHDDHSQFLSPTAGFPAIQVPMGYTRGATLPAGITIYGGPWSEVTLFRLAYAYERSVRGGTRRSVNGGSVAPLIVTRT